MPTFDFVCNNCGHMFEFVVTSYVEKPKCPKCFYRKTKRLFSPSKNDPRFIGSGFHINDYLEKKN